MVNRNLWIVTLIIGSLVTPPVISQELEEVIVTAQRREQSMQEVPVSITAFSGIELQKWNVKEAKDYLMFTPNVSFTEDGEVGQRSVGIAIRGISDFSNALTSVGGLSSSFGIYLDEVNIANSANKVANPQLFDLKRVEILRGPQGTYFGRNATGGALNLTTNLPQNASEYEFGAGYGRFDTWNTDAMVNFPVTDNFFVRAVVSYQQSDNFIENSVATGNDASYEHFSGRIALRWLLNDQTTADYSIMQTQENDGTDTTVNSGVFDTDTFGSSPTVLPVNPDGTLDTSPVHPGTVYTAFANLVPIDSGRGFYPENQRFIAKDFNESNTGSAIMHNLRLNYEGDGWSLRSITGYIDSTGERRFDQDVTQLAAFETLQSRFSDSFSEELRLRVERDSWDLTVGGIYTRDNADRMSYIPVGNSGFRIASLKPDGTVDTCFFCREPGGIISRPRHNTFDSTSYAFFADASWQITDRFKTTVGVRYTDDEVESNEYSGFIDDTAVLDASFNDGTTPPDRFHANQGKQTFTDVSSRFVLTYASSDAINLYASATSGYKPGGVILDVFDTPTGPQLGATPYNEETVWSYEAGIKLRALDNRLQVNAAAFFMDLTDMQVPSTDVEIAEEQIILNRRILNVDAEMKGAELEIQALPVENLFFSAGIGYLDATFTAFDETDPYVFEDMGFALKGVQLPRSPEWTLNAVGQYDFHATENTKTFVRLEWSYRSKTTSDIEAVATQLTPLDNAVTMALGLDTSFNGTGEGRGVPVPWPRDPFPFVVPAFDVFNLRAGIEGDGWSIIAYVENLLDDEYYTGTQENFGFGGIRIRPHPRIYGISFRLWSKE